MKYNVYDILPEFGTNTYLVWDENSRQAMIIDPAAPDRVLIEEIKNLKLDLKYIINTHGHGDHIGGNELIKANFDVPLCIHSLDADMLLNTEKNLSSYFEESIISPEADVFFEDNEIIKLGKNEVMIIHTPGHSRGGISILTGNLLFCGDTLFLENVGRADLPGGDFNTLVKLIHEKLFSLPDETIVLPGHGPSTTIGKEKRDNPFVKLA